MLKTTCGLLLAFCWAQFSLSQNAACPELITKSQWQGMPATNLTYQVRPIGNVVIHRTHTQECDNLTECSQIIREVQKRHMLGIFKHDDIIFNFMIGNDGRVYEGTGWGLAAAHTHGYSETGVGIAFIGNFNEHLPSTAALNAGKKLIECGVQTDDLAKNYTLYAGSDLLATESPGKFLQEELKSWPHKANAASIALIRA